MRMFKIKSSLYVFRNLILNWSKGIAKVNIVIALVINSQTAFKIRPQIQNLIQHLIDEQFIELLMTGSQLEIKNYLKQ